MKKTLALLLTLAMPVFLFSQNPLFKDKTSYAGINHQFQDLFPEMGSGVVFFDLNNDNLLDLFFTGGHMENSLYLNKGNGKFEDISTASGIQMPGIRKLGAVSGDMDNDGYRDLLVTTTGGYHNYLFRNLGNNTFQNITNPSGIQNVGGSEIEDQWSFSPTLGDFNLDGFLDIYINNWISEGQAIFDSITNEIIGYAHQGGPNRLYLNNGNLTFTEIATDMGVDDLGCALSGIFSDYDNDRDLDILIANDFGEWWMPDALFQNEFPDPHFTDLSAACGFDTKLYGMGIGVGDYDHDGDLDYYKTSIGSHVLMQNSGDGTFMEVAEAAGVKQQYVFDQPPYLSIGWGAGFLDFDNDTWPDLVVAQGALTQPDFFLPSLDSLPDKLFRNNSDGTFEDVTYLFETPNLRMSRGFAYGDYDNDGDVDLVFTSPRDYLATLNPGTPVLFENQLANGSRWLKVKLIGTINNRDAFGAHLLIYVDGISWRYEIGGGGHGHNSQHSSIAHFGLYDATKIDSLIVQWPGEMTADQVYHDIPANHFIEIIEGVDDYKILQGGSPNSSENAVNEKGFSIFPNPATEEFTILLDQAMQGEFSISIFDLLGKQTFISTFPAGNKQLVIQNNGFNVGTYIIQLANGSKTFQKRLVIGSF